MLYAIRILKVAHSPSAEIENDISSRSQHRLLNLRDVLDVDLLEELLEFTLLSAHVPPAWRSFPLSCAVHLASYAG